MKTYVIVAFSPEGEKKMIWIIADNYHDAKDKFTIKFPDHIAISMWLRARS